MQINNTLPLSSRPEFVALPSDPDVPLTPDQLAALFGGDIRGVLRTIARGYMASLAPTHSSLPTTLAPTSAVNGTGQ